MKVFITGGTGFVGSYLTGRLSQMGHEVTVITRSTRHARELPWGVSFVEGDPKTSGPWQQKVPEHDLVINLAGASIFTVWTKKARKAIMDSRILTTRNVVDALKMSRGETLFISASAVGYYGGREDDTVLDESSPAGRDFLAEVGMHWEAEARRAEDFGVRVVVCRFGIVLGRNGGALSKMIPAFRYFVGSPLGSGKQWFPWIHEEDLLRIMLFASQRKNLSGPLNCTAPFPVRNEEMTRSLAKALNRPVIMPAVPAFLLRVLLGEFGSVLLKGQRAVPKRLQDEGFEFQFPTFYEALRDLTS